MNRRSMMVTALASALLTALMLGSAWAQGSSKTLEITPSRDSGVSGTATLTETGGGVEVVLDVQGLPKDGIEHMAHIHEGATCADDRAGQGGEVKYPLESVVAEGDTGSSTSTVDATFDELFGGEAYYVNVHAEQTDPEAVPPGIACADVVSMSAGASASASAETLSDTGGIPPVAVLLAGATGLVTAGYLLRRLAA